MMKNNPMGAPCNSYKRSLLTLLIVCVAGCSTAPALRYYDLGSNTSTQQPLSCQLPVLYLSSITVPSVLQTDTMHYRLLYLDDVQMRDYAFHRWRMFPGELLSTHIKAQWAANGIRLAKYLTGSTIEVHIALDEFGHTLSSTREGNVEIQARVSLLQKQTLLAQTVVIEKVSVTPPTPVNSVQAMRVAVDKFTLALNNWLCKQTGS